MARTQCRLLRFAGGMAGNPGGAIALIAGIPGGAGGG